jgi:hypothetical protein
MRATPLVLLALLAIGQASQARDLYVLAAGDLDNPEIGSGVEKSLQWVVTYFDRQAPREILRMRVLAGEKLTASALTRSVEACPTKEDDAFVLWWVGRTEWEDDRRMLVMPDGERLPREELAETIAEKVQASLRIFVTDGATVACPSDPLPDVPEAEDALTTELFEELFLNSKGNIDIAATSPNRESLLLSGAGGLLTAALMLPPQTMSKDDANSLQIEVESGEERRNLVLSPGVLWRSVHKPQDWSQVLSQCRLDTSSYSRQASGSRKSQNCDVVSFNIMTARESIVYDRQSQDFRSYPRESATRESSPPPQQTADNAPPPVVEPPVMNEDDRSAHQAAIRELLRYRLASDTDEGCLLTHGDLIVSVNEQPIRTLRDFDTAVKKSPEFMGFTIRSPITGRRILLETELRSGAGSRFGVRATQAPLPGVLVDDIRENSAGWFAEFLEVQKPDLPKTVEFGASGRFAPIESEFLEGTKTCLVVEKVKQDTPAAWAGLKPGDAIVAIGELHFESEEGYRYAIDYAPFLATVLIFDGKTNEPANRDTFVPHTLPTTIQPPPPGVEPLALSIDPAQ